MRSSELADRHRARLASALHEVNTLGIYASQQAWDDRNTFECAVAHEERRLSRRTVRPSWLSSIVVPRWFGAGSEVML